MSLEAVDVWFQNEARFGQQNTTTRLWAPRETRPKAVKQQQSEYAYFCLVQSAPQEELAKR